MSVFKASLIIFAFLFYMPQLSAQETFDTYKIKPIDYQHLSIASNVRDTWKQNKITDYVYTVINKCFCDIAKRAQVFVYQNKIVKILDLDKASAPLDSADFEKYKTIDEHIEFIHNTLQNPVDKVYIDHDRHLGYPSKIFIDPNKRQADDETNININNLNLLILEQTVFEQPSDNLNQNQ